MNYDILLTKRNNKFIARVCQLPEIVVEANTEEGVITKARKGLKELLFGGKIVRLDIESEVNEHPWAKHAGMFANDSDWESFQETIIKHRKEVNFDGIVEP